MMKLLLIIIFAGGVVYVLLKLCLYIYRPFFLSKIYREIDKMYQSLMTATEKDVRSRVNDLEKWHAGDKVITTLSSKEDLIANIKAAEVAKTHEEEVHGKFLRLNERFRQDPDKLSDSIVAYRRYLEVRLKQEQDATVFVVAMNTGAMSFDEFAAAAKETKMVLEEIERKLDILLT